MNLVERLAEKGLSLATAESLTGGMIAAAVVDIPGASTVFHGGIVSYTDDVKHRVLGVSTDALRKYTAVSEAVAREMAENVARMMESDCAISSTGIAGPGGGTEETPVGCVFVGITVKGVTEVHRLSLSGTRDEIRKNTVAFALDALGKRIEKL